MRSHAPTAAALLALAAASPASAQTPDLLFGGWTWRPRETGGRPAGLGGSFVAVADDARAAVVNPAGIALVPQREVAMGTADLWAVAAFALRGDGEPVSLPPTQPAAPGLPCPPGPAPRPWAVAFFAEQALEREVGVEAVAGPGLLEEGALRFHREQIGASVARGLTPWLNLGLTVAWRHLRFEGRSALQTLEGAELSRVTLDGDASKARVTLGALAMLGGPVSHRALRLGVAYQRDLSRWPVERRSVNVAEGTVGAAARVHIEEPPVLSAAAAVRLRDTWLLSAQVDYIAYREVIRTLRRNAGESAAPFRLDDAVEPRVAVEYTADSPIGGYFKLRAGLRRETSGRLRFEGEDLARQQAFRGARDKWRGSAGVSLLAEFYEKGARLDLDVSEVVVATTSSVAAAGTRRFSFGLTVRL